MPKSKVVPISQLIPINSQKISRKGTQAVNARDVHEFLEVKKDFSNWIKDKIKNYDFIEGQDFVCSPNLASKTGSGGHNIKEYFVSLDMAKELSMVQNNPKGKEARKYFIQCETTLKELTSRLARHAERKAQIEYQQARAESKFIRREETDIIQKFVEYATQQGSKNAKMYYVNISKMERKALFYFEQTLPKPNNFRELLDMMQLAQISVADNLVNRALQEGMDKGMFYKDIYAMVKERVENYAICIGKTTILFLPDMTKKREQLSLMSPN